MIHVCYGLYDGDGRYSKFTGTSILSMFENLSAPPKSVTVHILHDSTLTRSNCEKFIYLAGRYEQNIEFYNVERLCADKMEYLLDNINKIMQNHFRRYVSIGAFYRLFIPMLNFGNVSKVIYLDGDTIVNLDIQELWQYPIGKYAIAAVPEIQATRDHMIQNKYLLKSGKVKVENYFCSGIMILNLEKFDKDFFYKAIQWRTENLQCECFDQDILNNFFSTNYCKLPEKFDSFVGVSKSLDNNVIFRKIYHYAGNTALGFDMKNSHDKLFFSYFVKTPWFNEDTLSNMFEGVRQLYVEQKEFAIVLSAISAGKERVFFVSADVTDVVKQIFAIKDTEEFIVENEKDSIKILIESMKQSEGKKLAMVMVENFATVKPDLDNAGFIEGQDFIDATLFLSDDHGFPLSAWRFLKSL